MLRRSVGLLKVLMPKKILKMVRISMSITMMI